MKEVVTLQVGKCGNFVGTQFWEILCSEHGLNVTGNFHGTSPEVQLPRINTFFREVRGLRYVPRAVMIDLDKDALEMVKSSHYTALFGRENLVYGQGGTGNNWAKGHLTEGQELKEPVFHAIRREAERTDCLQGFQVIHSIGGGTGSGLGALIMDNLMDEYSGRNISSFTVVPSPVDPKSGVEVYNAVLAMSHLILQSDGTFLIDNYALDKILSDIPNLSHYLLSDLNYVISSALSGITTCMRFHGQPNTDFRKIAVNFVPFPRMHFFVPALAPITSRNDLRSKTPTVNELYHNIFNQKKMFVDCDMRNGQFLTVAAFFRGAVCAKDVVMRLEDVLNKNSSRFIEWVPDNAKTFVYELPASVVKVSATMLANTTAIQNLLKRLKGQFNLMFRRKAFLTPFKNEGMDEMEFEEAAENLNDLIAEYKQSQMATADGSDKRLGSLPELDRVALS